MTATPPADSILAFAAALTAHKAGRLAEAENGYREVLAQAPNHPDALHLLAVLLQQSGQPSKAKPFAMRAVDSSPQAAVYHNTLGLILTELSETAAAILELKQAVRLAPGKGEYHVNLAGVLLATGNPIAAAETCREGLINCPEDIRLNANLATALIRQGLANEALTELLPVFKQNPANQAVLSVLVMAASYASKAAPGLVLEATRHHWQARSASTYPALMPARTRQLGAPLRIGFLSPDLRHHVVSHFLAAPLAAIDRKKLEPVLLSLDTRQDEMTERLKQSAEWHFVARPTDEETAREIAALNIDILLDLAGFTADGRPGVLAHRPAPVQGTWIGYNATTGLDAVDFVIADDVAIPESHSDQYTETILRLPGCYACYDPQHLALPVSPAVPQSRGRPPTFGSFNTLAKISDDTLSLWARLLSQVDGSRLLLRTKHLASEGAQTVTRERAKRAGINPARLILSGGGERQTHLAAYEQVDVALDPFPYGGATTTLEALTQGVPVITMAGDRWVGRMSASFLNHAGLEEFIATDQAAYLRLATALIQDTTKLAELRTSLRSILLNSPVCDAERFARTFEITLQRLWQTVVYTEADEP